MTFYTPHRSGHSAANHMFRAPKIDFAMINVSYPLVSDGILVWARTWAIGATAKRALNSWLRSRPDIDPTVVEHSVVTESKWSAPRTLEPIGERVEISDPLLASFR
jgi:hypothetical protein